MGRVSDDLRALVTEIEACTGSFDELERPPGILVDSNVTLNSGDMTHQVGKWYEKLQLEIQSSLQDLEQATAALVTTELAKVGANTGSGLLLSINDELATTLQELSVGATEAFSSEVAQNLAPTFELTRDVQLATTELLRAVDEFVGASEKCKECVAHLQALPYLLERIP